MKFLHLSTVAALALMASPAFAQYLAQPDQVPTRYIPSVNAPTGSPQPAMTEYSAAAPASSYNDPNAATPHYPTPVPVPGYTPPVPYAPPAGTSVTYSGSGIATQPLPTPPALPVPAYTPPPPPPSAPTPVAVPTPPNPQATIYSAPMGSPNPAQANGDFVSGGVGESDQARMNALAKDYNLKVLYAGAGGEYLAIVNAKITDKSGNVLYQSATDGPILLARLKPGTYTLESELNGQVKTNKVSVGHGLKSIIVRL